MAALRSVPEDESICGDRYSDENSRIVALRKVHGGLEIDTGGNRPERVGLQKGDSMKFTPGVQGYSSGMNDEIFFNRDISQTLVGMKQRKKELIARVQAISAVLADRNIKSNGKRVDNFTYHETKAELLKEMAETNAIIRELKDSIKQKNVEKANLEDVIKRHDIPPVDKNILLHIAKRLSAIKEELSDLTKIIGNALNGKTIDT